VEHREWASHDRSPWDEVEAGSPDVKRKSRLAVTHSRWSHPVVYTHYTDLQDLDGSSYRRPSLSSVGLHGDGPSNHYLRLFRWRERCLARLEQGMHGT
jgi:hypothetical protein